MGLVQKPPEVYSTHLANGSIKPHDNRSTPPSILDYYRETEVLALPLQYVSAFQESCFLEGCGKGMYTTEMVISCTRRTFIYAKKEQKEISRQVSNNRDFDLQQESFTHSTAIPQGDQNNGQATALRSRENFLTSSFMVSLFSQPCSSLLTLLQIFLLVPLLFISISPFYQPPHLPPTQFPPPSQPQSGPLLHHSNEVPGS